jgi:hypothetical protein
VRDNKPQRRIKGDTSRSRGRLASRASRLLTLASNLLSFLRLPVLPYRRSPRRLEASAAGTPSPQDISLPDDRAQGGLQIIPAGWARTNDEKTCTHLVHIVSTGSFASVGASGERLGINLGLKGCTGSVRQELQRPEPGFPITYERTQVGLAPIVSDESCPSMGRSKKKGGGSVPPCHPVATFL